MVLQKVLMAMEVEQHEFMFWFYFRESCEEGVWLKKKKPLKVYSFFFPPSMSHSAVSSTVHGLRLEKSFQNISANFSRDCHNLTLWPYYILYK